MSRVPNHETASYNFALSQQHLVNHNSKTMFSIPTGPETVGDTCDRLMNVISFEMRNLGAPNELFLPGQPWVLDRQKEVGKGFYDEVVSIQLIPSSII